MFSSLGVAIAIPGPLAPSSRWVTSHVQGHHRGLSGQGKDWAFLCCGFNTGELSCSDSNCEHVGWAILGSMSHAGRTLETLRKQDSTFILLFYFVGLDIACISVYHVYAWCPKPNPNPNPNALPPLSGTVLPLPGTSSFCGARQILSHSGQTRQPREK